MRRNCHMCLAQRAEEETAERFPPPDDPEHRGNRSDPVPGGQCAAIATLT